MDRNDIKCACGGIGGLHNGDCPVVIAAQKPVEKTREDLEREVDALRAVVARYARAVDIAQRVLASV